MFISDDRKNELNDFQKKHKLHLSNLELLNTAFVHSSYIREQELDIHESYEKLEFFGDAVLKLVVSEYLYNNFKDYMEGELTKLRAEFVSDRNIARYAQILGIDEMLILSRNEKKQKGNKKESILACSFEALLGAIYIEKGYRAVWTFLERFFEDITSIEEKIDTLNPRAILQEYTQGINKKLPKYKLTNEIGSAHAKTFFEQVIFEDKVIGEGQGPSIKKAQANAARDALINLGVWKGDE